MQQPNFKNRSSFRSIKLHVAIGESEYIQI